MDVDLDVEHDWIFQGPDRQLPVTKTHEAIVEAKHTLISQMRSQDTGEEKQSTFWSPHYATFSNKR